MPTSEPDLRFAKTIAGFDQLNADDRRREFVDGIARPREVVYSERMSACLARLYPQASESLRLAARAQHICRWQIVRQDYPVGRDGYNAWRAACRGHHTALATSVMRECGYAEAECARVASLIAKENLKRDPDSQALENVVGVVFVEYYLAAFVEGHADYDEAKLLGILRKTMRKLDGVGHAAIHSLALPEPMRRLVSAAMAGGG